MARLILSYWRDIPMRVMVRDGRLREQKSLSARFQTAMERAALREGKGQSHALLDDWRKQETEQDGDMTELLQAELSRLEQAYDDTRLKALERACGWDNDGRNAADPTA